MLLALMQSSTALFQQLVPDQAIVRSVMVQSVLHQLRETHLCACCQYYLKLQSLRKFLMVAHFVLVVVTTSHVRIYSISHGSIMPYNKVLQSLPTLLDKRGVHVTSPSLLWYRRNNSS